MNRQDVLEAVSQAWCTDENKNKVMDPDLAYAAINNIMARATSEALDVIKQEMIADDPSKQGSYAHSWHCNIAMMCVDAITTECPPTAMPYEDAHKIGNDAASRFMKLCFGVETSA